MYNHTYIDCKAENELLLSIHANNNNRKGVYLVIIDFRYIFIKMAVIVLLVRVVSFFKSESRNYSF